jgi:ribosomal-protein-alanine N-acetyltransferase
MNYQIGEFTLRHPEPVDLKALYQQKNEPEVAAMLVGFSTGYSMADLSDWLEHHQQVTDEVLWVIADAGSNQCVGHVGLYKIDHRIRSAEFGILIGDRSVWGKGLGRACTKFALDYGFQELNLNRICLSVLATNERAISLYNSLRFKEEGLLQQAQYKGGRYIDVLLMRILREENLTGSSMV